MPRTLGDAMIDFNRLDAAPKSIAGLFELALPAESEPLRRISEQIAGMIGDGDCLQIR